MAAAEAAAEVGLEVESFLGGEWCRGDSGDAQLSSLGVRMVSHHIVRTSATPRVAPPPQPDAPAGHEAPPPP